MTPRSLRAAADGGQVPPVLAAEVIPALLRIKGHARGIPGLATILHAARKVLMSVTLRWPCWIGVVADDLDRQRRFYGDVLGFTEIAAGADWVHFDLGESRLLEIVRRSGQPQYDQARYQVGYAVEDIEDARKQLIARGVQPVSDLEGSCAGGGRWCYFRDAEGNVFELKERRQERA